MVIKESNNQESNNTEPNYDELLRDLDLSPSPDFSSKIDKQLEHLLAKLDSLNYSEEDVVKVMTKAMSRCEAILYDDETT